jgi:hypothetical protein
MASKSKRAQMSPARNMSKAFMYWAIAVFIVKVLIILRIEGINTGSVGKMFYVDGAWLGADGENYLVGYNALLKEGIFSPEGILNYWPAGYPLFILLLSLLGKSWVLTTLSIVQSLLFSYAAYLFASQLYKTRIKNFSYIILLFILLNPTLSLSSIVIGYESITASGLIIILALIVKSFNEKNEQKFLRYLIINSTISGLLVFLQPRLILSCVLIIFIWIITWKGLKAGAFLIILSLAITLFFPATLIYRNHKSVGLNSISTNLGVTMNIGAGDRATGGYMQEGYGVPCELSGTSVEQDNQRVKCVLDWYTQNPTKAIKLFYNKSVYFWSPWFGPVANGTMARNPWLKISPLQSIASKPEGVNLILGPFGKLVSWVWLIGGLALLFYGYLALWRQNSLERFLGNLAIIAIGTNWLVSLISIGDHRFRIPIMGISLFLQAIGLKSLFGGRKLFMVEGPTLR